MNKELFNINKQAKIEYIEAPKKQSQIKNSFFENREIICKNSNNKDFIICSKHFQEFYVNHKYHYGECTENIIKDIITDIQNIDKKFFKCKK